MSTNNTTTITEAQVREFLASLLARVSPDGRSGIVQAVLSVSEWDGADYSPRASFCFSGHGITLADGPTCDALAVAVASNTPAAKALRRKEQLERELADINAKLEAKS